MTKSREKIFEGNTDENWVICGGQIVTQIGRDKGLENGNASKINNLIEQIAEQIDKNGNVLIKAESYNKERDNKGRIVKRIAADGTILTGRKQEQDKDNEK